ncbi:hypothetical protein J4436_04645 [Candidatus Woesearchaeota archaeon]|nr:hypothetical protein [Candidatus Woesearchaeota archaeon]
MKYLDKLIKGEIKPYRLEDLILGGKEIDRAEWKVIEKKAQRLRRRYYEYLVKKTQGLPQEWTLERNLLFPYSSPECKLIGKPQIENSLIGPYGFVGPVNIHGIFANGDYYPILFTWETQLIRAINAGASHARRYGGINTVVEDNGMTRAPLIIAKSENEAMDFIKFVQSKKGRLRKLIDSRMNHGYFMGIDSFRHENAIYLRMRFNTGDSMGMNMATFEADIATKWLVKHFRGNVKYISVSSNMCTDKKVTPINAILGRGKRVDVHIKIPLEELKSYLAESKRSISEFRKMIDLKNKGSDIAGGGIGTHNTHVANIVGNMFPAYAQDHGQIGTSSMADKYLELEKGFLKYSLTMYCLEVGTVGGGTDYKPANIFLQALGCRDPITDRPYKNSALKFAEIIGATAICGELGTDLALIKGVLPEYHRNATRK